MDVGFKFKHINNPYIIYTIIRIEDGVVYIESSEGGVTEWYGGNLQKYVDDGYWITVS